MAITNYPAVQFSAAHIRPAGVKYVKYNAYNIIIINITHACRLSKRIGLVLQDFYKK